MASICLAGIPATLLIDYIDLRGMDTATVLSRHRDRTPERVCVRTACVRYETLLHGTHTHTQTQSAHTTHCNVRESRICSLNWHELTRYARVHYDQPALAVCSHDWFGNWPRPQFILAPPPPPDDRTQRNKMIRTTCGHVGGCWVDVGWRSVVCAGNRSDHAQKVRLRTTALAQHTHTHTHTFAHIRRVHRPNISVQTHAYYRHFID